MATTGKIIIQGLTKEGSKFRPSDWAERLCSAIASYGPGRRIIFHPAVTMTTVNGVKSVVIDAALEQDDSMLFEFLTDFANENNLHVIDSDSLATEQQKENPE